MAPKCRRRPVPPLLARDYSTRRLDYLLWGMAAVPLPAHHHLEYVGDRPTPITVMDAQGLARMDTRSPGERTGNRFRGFGALVHLVRHEASPTPRSALVPLAPPEQAEEGRETRGTESATATAPLAAVPTPPIPAGPASPPDSRLDLVSLPLRYLFNGAVLGCDLVTEEGLKLLATGHEITVEDLVRIRAFSRETRLLDPVQVVREKPRL